MVTAATQKRQRKADAKTKAAAKARVEELKTKAKVKANGKKAAKGEYSITAADIEAERDTKGLSWKQVGINLDLGSPSAARKAYTVLTGRPHYESQMTGKRAPRGTGLRRSKSYHPNWNDDSDQDEIIAKLQGQWIEESGSGQSYLPAHWSGSTITVRRHFKGVDMGEEEVRVSRVDKLTYDGKDQDGPLVVHVGCRTSGATRSFRVADIVGVR